MLYPIVIYMLQIIFNNIFCSSKQNISKKTKNKAKIRISKLEKRKTNISKKTNNEIEKLEKAKNDYIHTKMKEFQL